MKQEEIEQQEIEQQEIEQQEIEQEESYQLNPLQDPLCVDEETWGQRWRRVIDGLKAPKDSGEYKFSIFYLRRLYASSGSSTVLLALLIIAGALFTGNADLQPPNLEVNVVEPEKEELEKIEEEPPPEEPPEITEINEFNPVQDKVETLSETPALEVPSFGDDSSEEMIDMAVDIIKSPMVIKGLYGARLGGGKANAVGKYGGKRGGGALTAVLKALRWLKAHQEADGSWIGKNERDRTAMCGLALLCFLAHGETPASKEFGQTVEKAIQYLLYAQEASGRFKDCGEHYSYGHAIATYALCEAFTMTKMYMLKEPAEKALQIIIDGQQGGGAFDYEYNKGARKDMSVTAWNVQALKAGTICGASNPKLADALYKCVDGVKSFAASGGGFGYDGPGNQPNLTGAGILCLQLLGHAGDPEVKNSLEIQKNVIPEWPGKGLSTYGWYYLTQGRFQNGGPLWKSWNDAMLPMMVQNQQTDGHWEAGSTHQASPVYDTTLCCLCLEVYYRYLPTYEKLDDGANKGKVDEGGDVKIAVGKVL